MSIKVVALNRQNQWQGLDEVEAINNTGAVLKQGMVVLLDTTLDENLTANYTNSAIAPSTAAKIANMPKMVYIGPAGNGGSSIPLNGSTDLANGTLGRFRIRGRCGNVLIGSNATVGDSLTILTVAATGGAYLSSLTVNGAQAIGNTTGIWAAKNMGLATANLTANGTATVLSPVNFDGSDVNGLFIKD